MPCSLCLAVLLTAVAICPDVATVAAESTWQRQRENLSEYRLVSSRSGVPSELECLIVHGESAAAATTAVTFDASGGNCSVFRCLLGDWGRKCRNARNSSMPLVWMPGSRSNCWTTFQHRVDGSLNFNRNWSQYATGFGQGEDLNYWMGLEPLFQLTNAANCQGSGSCRVRWEFSDWNDTYYWAENPRFYISSAADKYRLSMAAVDASRSNVNQTPISDGWSPNSQQFSTPESDNDGVPNWNCAQGISSGWWFGSCTSINANAQYNLPPAAYKMSSPDRTMTYFYVGSAYPLELTYSLMSFECLVLTV